MLVILPFDIINNIMLYTRKSQNNDLLEDIRDYTISKNLILDFYTYNNYFVVTYEDEIITNLFQYANNEHLHLHDFSDKFYSIWARLYGLNRNNIKKFISKLENKSLNTQINCFIGILLPIERKEFILKQL